MLTSAPGSDDFRLLPETATCLSVQTQNYLMRAGYTGVKQLLATSSDDLLRAYRIGPAALAEIQSWKAAVVQAGTERYRNTHRHIAQLLSSLECPASPSAATMLLALIWQLIEQEPHCWCRVEQMLTPPEIES